MVVSVSLVADLEMQKFINRKQCTVIGRAAEIHSVADRGNGHAVFAQRRVIRLYSACGEFARLADGNEFTAGKFGVGNYR